MFPFVESIKYSNYLHYNLKYHQARLDDTRSRFYPGVKPVMLKEVLVPPAETIEDNIYKCRVIYGESISEITYELYTPRIIDQYYLLDCPEYFDYSYKFTDRSMFDNVRINLKKNEDYIYIRNGLITDTSFANLIFSDGNSLFTPADPLLKGTKRAYYIKQGIVKEEEIKVNDLKKFKYLQIINAMIDLESLQTYPCERLLISKLVLK